MKKLLLLLTAFLAFGFFAGCDDEPNDPPKTCADVTCPSGQVCVAETLECVTVDLCENVTCCTGKTCNPVTGQCEGTCDSLDIVNFRQDAQSISDAGANVAGQDVSGLTGVVVAVKGGTKPALYVQQQGATEWAGLYVYMISISGELANYAEGDVITIAGKHSEYFGLTEITPAEAGNLTKTGTAAVPAPISLAVTGLEEKYESMLVSLTGGPFTVTEEATGTNFYNTTLKDSLNNTFKMKSDIQYPKYNLPVGTVLQTITGMVAFDYSEFKVYPRKAEDLGGAADPCAGITCEEGKVCQNGTCVDKTTEDTDALCSDGIDNDGDGFKDCDDYDCSRNAAVTVCGGTNCDPACETGYACVNGTCVEQVAENTDALCSDGIDNDGDGFKDCDDYDCSRNTAVTVCGGTTCDPACETGFTCVNGTCVADTTETKTVLEIRQTGVIGANYQTSGIVTAVVVSSQGKVKGVYVQNSANDFDGLYLFFKTAGDSTVVVGDNVTATGKYADYNGASQLEVLTTAEMTINSNGNTVPAARQIAATGMTNSNEAQLVELTGGPFTITVIGDAGNSYNTTVKDAANNTFVMRSALYRFTDAPMSLGNGSILTTIKGVVTEYNGVFSVQPRFEADLAVVQVECTPACEEWESCVAENTCEVAAGRCATNTDCTGLGETCNTTSHVCEVVCTETCEEWETCTAGTPNSCVLNAGRCVDDEDCTGGATCNTETNRCAGGANPQFANGDFSVWTDDTTPANWTSGNLNPTLSKVERSTGDFALGISGYNATSNPYAISSNWTAVNDTLPTSITFDVKGSGKISVNIACDLNNDELSTGEQKIYNLDVATDVFTNAGTNSYTEFTTSDAWKTFTITTGAELVDFWKSGVNCRLEIKAGKAVQFDVTIDNVTVNY
ncbi:hypothetical protein JXR93_01835 [bacterium]|nr:hypothetical protein [bacterium]